MIKFTEWKKLGLKWQKTGEITSLKSFEGHILDFGV